MCLALRPDFRLVMPHDLPHAPLSADALFPELLDETMPQRDIDLVAGRRMAEVPQRCHAILRDSARHDAPEMGQVRIDIERNAVKRDPMAHADADRADLVLAPLTHETGTPIDPDADPPVANLARHPELG